MSHTIDPRLLSGRVGVSLVGAGGNGSQMLSGLVRLHRALLSVGHPGGLQVTVYDPDRVSEANIGRQLFYPTDVGNFKASVLVNRVNLCFGLGWRAMPQPYNSVSDPGIVIGCVDTAAARRQIAKLARQRRYAYWLDLGNTRTNGQVILGQPFVALGNAVKGKNQEEAARIADELEAQRLRTVVEIFPELLDTRRKEDNEPSCSLAEALDRQSLFVNQHVSTWALSLLWDLFRHGKIDYHGAFINLQTGRVNPLPVPKPKPAAPEPEKKPAARRRRRTA